MIDFLSGCRGKKCGMLQFVSEHGRQMDFVGRNSCAGAEKQLVRKLAKMGSNHIGKLGLHRYI